ncbi:hypothetical protein CKF58_04400 [Psittacicella hinzii]|uniref:tRNA-specific adenosine deaminase n=2 Tax=Psittacicella hinzii TaxID=2028575 RepID=A0A3A1YL50_9GAMM|nr:hypothetical protein CKF58_04400 [Psittacicella hinzii]
MELCLDLTKIAEKMGEVPIAAIIVIDDKIKGIGLNAPICLHDATAHAEVMAIRDAGQRVGNYRLPDSTMYITLEPCPMCSGAILHARCKRVVFGATDLKTGTVGGRFNLFKDYPMNHQPKITSGVRAVKVQEELSGYFQRKRILQKEQKRLLRAATLMLEEQTVPITKTKAQANKNKAQDKNKSLKVEAKVETNINLANNNSQLQNSSKLAANSELVMSDHVVNTNNEVKAQILAHETQEQNNNALVSNESSLSSSTTALNTVDIATTGLASEALPATNTQPKTTPVTKDLSAKLGMKKSTAQTRAQKFQLPRQKRIVEQPTLNHHDTDE